MKAVRLGLATADLLAKRATYTLPVLSDLPLTQVAGTLCTRPDLHKIAHVTATLMANTMQGLIQAQSRRRVRRNAVPYQATTDAVTQFAQPAPV